MADWNLSRDPLEALRDGDHAPFEAFVDQHARTFFFFFRRRGASPEVAEDLTQDVFLKLYDHALRYRAEERFQGLCYRVARNLWIDHRRRRSLRMVEPDRGGGLPEGDIGRGMGREPEAEPVAGMILREEAGRLRRGLRGISPGHREVFELAVIDGLGYAEIARALEIPVGTVKSRMFHAVRKLRALMESHGDPSDGPDCPGGAP